YWGHELRTGDETRRFAVRMQMMSIGAEAVPSLVEALRGDDEGVREDAAAALAGIAAHEPPDEVMEALLAALTDPNPLIRSNAASALGYVSPARAGEVRPAL